MKRVLRNNVRALLFAGICTLCILIDIIIPREYYPLKQHTQVHHTYNYCMLFNNVSYYARKLNFMTTLLG